MADIRLNKLIKQFNIGLDTLVDYLNSLGAGIENATPNTTVSDEYLPTLNGMFGKDYDLNEASSKVGVTITEILGKSAKKSISPPIETNKSMAPSKPPVKVTPKENGIRLGKIMTDLNIDLDRLVRYINALGYEVEADLDARIPRSLFPRVLQEYADEFIKTESTDTEAKARKKREKRTVIKKKPEIIVDPHKIELQKAVENNIVEGVVTEIGHQKIIVDIGLPNKGILPAKELKYMHNLEVGDKVEVFADGSIDRKGRPIISHRIVLQLKSWDKVYSAFKRGECIKGYVIRRAKGGLLVNLEGFQAFLPGSEVEIGPILDYDTYIGKWMKFKILQFDSESRNVIVSRKAILEPELEAKRAEFLSNLKEGQTFEGTVIRIIGYGALVDLGPADGLIHTSELKRNGIINPKEEISIGQRIDVVVLKVDEQQKRISLGLQQLN